MYKIYVDKIEDLNMVVNHNNIKAEQLPEVEREKGGMVVGRLGPSPNILIHQEML